MSCVLILVFGASVMAVDVLIRVLVLVMALWRLWLGSRLLVSFMMLFHMMVKISKWSISMRFG